MSKIVVYPANGYDFDAADVAAYLAGLTSGVFSGAEDFPVTAAGGLKVTVGAGRGWVHPSRFTGYSITKREADTLTMPLADPSLPRIDRIVMRYDAGARAASLQVLQGTASSAPTAPAISRTELIYDLCLAEITRPAGSTSISTGQITDTRLDEALCGIVRDGVTGIPTDELLAAAKERINALEEKATSSAAAAKDSAEAAKSSETKSAASEKAAKTSETAAKQALQDTETEHTTALQDITQARTAALNDVAASTKTATAAANTATQQATAAAGSASTAATKAGEASTSAGAAATSRQAAEKAQKAAEDAAALAGTRAGTDKTLSVPDAPADAKAVGDKFKSIKTDWNSVTDKPSTFPPSAHNHSAANITSGILGLARGGTGCSTALDACNALLKRGGVPKNQNWNDLTTGVWTVDPESFGSNSPSGIYPYGAVIVFSIDGSCIQVYVAHNTGAMMFRQRFSSSTSFSGWALVNTGGTLSAYPVGAIYISTSSTSPASLFGGTWESIASERVLMGVSSSHGAGSTVSAGLPNITGVLKDLFVSGHFNQSTGAFKRSSASVFSEKTDSSDWLGWADAQFYASDSNSIYGNSSTVQPAAYYVYMWRRTA